MLQHTGVHHSKFYSASKEAGLGSVCGVSCRTQTDSLSSVPYGLDLLDDEAIHSIALGLVGVSRFHHGLSTLWRVFDKQCSLITQESLAIADDDLNSLLSWRWASKSCEMSLGHLE